MPTVATTNRRSKTKIAAKRGRLPAGVTGAALLVRAKSGEFARGIDWTAVSLAYASRRKRSRAA